MVLGKTLERPLNFKEIQPVHSKGDQSWVFIRKTDAKAQTPILLSPHVKSGLFGKDSDAGKDWGQEEKGATEDEVVDGITDSMDIKVKVKSLSHVRLFATPWTVAYQAPPFMGFCQAKVLEWFAISFSRGSFQPRD